MHNERPDLPPPDRKATAHQESARFLLLSCFSSRQNSHRRSVNSAQFITSIIILYILSFLLKKSFLIYHYKYNVYLKVNENIYKFKGYLDTGNTLLKDGKPIIFIKEKVLINEDLKDGINFKYHTLNNKMREEKGYEGEIIIKINYKKIYKKIIFSIVSDDYYFNNCDCLLNAYCR